MHIVHLTTVHGALDSRIFFKQCRTLAAAGHQVTEVAGGGCERVESGVRIVPVQVPANRLLRATVGAWRAWRTVRRLRPDVVHVHDPELLFTALLLRPRAARLVYDMHELVHRQILDKLWLGPLWLRRAMAWCYTRCERLAVAHSAAVVLAEARYASEQLARHPGHAGKFTIVRNFPVLSVIDARRAPEPREDGFTLIYVGSLTPPRGIEELVRAVHQVDGCWLWLLGPWVSDAFRRRCEALAGWSRVRYRGLVRMDQVYEHVRAADLGVCVLHPLPNYVITEPIKTYEYLACGLPLLLSDFPHWRERFGPFAWFVDPLDIDAIARAITSARDAAEERHVRAAAGRKVVEAERCWERESQRLLDLYQGLQADRCA